MAPSCAERPSSLGSPDADPPTGREGEGAARNPPAWTRWSFTSYARLGSLELDSHQWYKMNGRLAIVEHAESDGTHTWTLDATGVKPGRKGPSVDMGTSRIVLTYPEADPAEGDVYQFPAGRALRGVRRSPEREHTENMTTLRAGQSWGHHHADKGSL